ncbi:MAG: YceI family protein [Deltaproteobacteria bacterium]|nr:YceI family protein [Deltaproteobacteria bacterium]
MGKRIRVAFVVLLALGLPTLGPSCKRADSAAGSGGAGAAAAPASGGFGLGEEESGPPPAISDGHWTFDPGHVFVLFKARHFGAGYVYGMFKETTGSVTLDSADPSKNRVEMIIQAGSLETFNGRRDEHLRGPDFLNAVQFPTLSVRSSSLAREPDGTWTAAGELTIRGTSKTVTLRARPLAEVDDPMGKRRAAFETSFVIPRLEYGVSFMPEAFGHDVFVLVAVEATKD